MSLYIDKNKKNIFFPPIPSFRQLQSEAQEFLGLSDLELSKFVSFT